MQISRYDGTMTTAPHEAFVYEHMLLSRGALQGTPAHGRDFAIDRSATVLLARLEASGPMSVGELADAFGLDVSTVHRQVAAAMKAGLIERLPDPAGGPARKHRPTPLGSERLHEEFTGRTQAVERVTAEWSDDDVAQLTMLLRRFNEDAEAVRGQPWPRPE